MDDSRGNEICGAKTYQKRKATNDMYSLNGVSYDFMNNYGFKLQAGRNFSENISSDKTAIIALTVALEKLKP